LTVVFASIKISDGILYILLTIRCQAIVFFVEDGIFTVFWRNNFVKMKRCCIFVTQLIKMVFSIVFDDHNEHDATKKCFLHRPENDFVYK